jgi:hypothetical protein
MDTPRIGTPFQLTLCNLPQNVALLAMGWQRLPAPVSLASVGMPGCTLEISPDATAILVGQGGCASWSLAIPDAPSLVGVRYYNQALVLDQSANAFGAVMSAAAEGIVGHW